MMPTIPMIPPWFNPHGFKMGLGGEPIRQVIHENEVLIGNPPGRSASEAETPIEYLETRRVAQVQIKPSLERGRFKVLWLITFFAKEYVQGEIHLLTNEMKHAFALLPDDSGHNVMKDRFGADGVLGHYIRKGKFLNLPMPGTGMDGDPNISIFVTDEIQEAVRKLILV